ncbi:MAG: hypothetical protein RI995_23 [Bacteroidota bacterium]|jgi:cell division protein FtsW
MHRIKSLKLELKGDYQIWLIVLVLNLFGLLVQFSAKGRIAMMSPWDPITSFLKTIIILGISFYLMAYFSRQNYIKLAKFSEIALLASWVLIGAAYLFGTSKGGASRWLEIGPISFMPSDMAKLCLTASLAKDFSTKQSDSNLYTPPVLFYIFFKIGVTCFLIMMSNFSTSALIFASSIVLMIFGRVPFKHIGLMITIFISGAVMVVMLGIGQRAQTIRSRIENFVARRDQKEVNIDKKMGEDYQITRSLYAIATGGITPKGPGKSQQKYFLSQAESDFIYAIIIEEYGLFAAIGIPLLFLYFLYRGARAVHEAMVPFGGLLSAGLTSSIVFQAFINMFVSVDAGPVTGQPMPMISAGGTSLIFTAISIGLILAVSEDKKRNIRPSSL